MRKLLIVAILAGVALAGAAACSTPSTTPTSAPTSGSAGGSAPTTAAAADQTAAVCSQALALEKSDGAQVLTEVQTYLAAVASGNAGNSAQTLADLEKIQADWVTAFQGFAGQPVKPEVKTALQNFLTFVQGFGNTASGTPNLTQIQAQYNQLDQALTTACAG
jgi:hypothetical protein